MRGPCLKISSVSGITSASVRPCSGAAAAAAAHVCVCVYYGTLPMYCTYEPERAQEMSVRRAGPTANLAHKPHSRRASVPVGCASRLRGGIAEVGKREGVVSSLLTQQLSDASEMVMSDQVEPWLEPPAERAEVVLHEEIRPTISDWGLASKGGRGRRNDRRQKRNGRLDREQVLYALATRVRALRLCPPSRASMASEQRVDGQAPPRPVLSQGTRRACYTNGRRSSPWTTLVAKHRRYAESSRPGGEEAKIGTHRGVSKKHLGICVKAELCVRLFSSFTSPLPPGLLPPRLRNAAGV